MFVCVSYNFYLSSLSFSPLTRKPFSTDFVFARSKVECTFCICVCVRRSSHSCSFIYREEYRPLCVCDQETGGRDIKAVNRSLLRSANQFTSMLYYLKYSCNFLSTDLCTSVCLSHSHYQRTDFHFLSIIRLHLYALSSSCDQADAIHAYVRSVVFDVFPASHIHKLSLSFSHLTHQNVHKHRLQANEQSHLIRLC